MKKLFSKYLTVLLLVLGCYSASISNSLSQNCTLPPGLVGWWRAEGDGNDSVGTNHGTLYGVSISPGISGLAFDIAPPGNRVRIPDSKDFELTNSLTIEGWIKPTAPGGAIFHRSDARPGIDPYGLTMDGSNVAFTISSVFTSDFILTPPIELGVWHHVAGTLNGTNGDMSLYIDGVLQAHTTTAVQPVGPLVPEYGAGIGIGNVGELNADYGFTGQIDEMALYSRALPADEILAIYYASGGDKCLGAPIIQAQPASQTVNGGETANFSVVVSGSFPFDYQWLFNGSTLVDATNSTLVISNAQPTNAGNYSVVITNGDGAVTSSIVSLTLTVNTNPPTITRQPANQTVLIGNTITMDVTVTGAVPFSYQWLFNGTNLNGATAANLIIPNSQPIHSGIYSVVITNNYGVAISSNATMIVTASPPCTPPPAGIVGWWRAEGNGKDSAGTNHGTLYGIPFVPGKVGKAFNLIPPRHKVRIPDSVDFQLTNSLTIEGWIKPTGLGGAIFYRSDDRDSSDPYGISMGFDTNIVFSISSRTNSETITAPVQMGEWQHVAATLDGTNGTMSLYINGVLLAQTATTVRPMGPLTDNGGIGIGNVAELGIADFNFTGLIDEMALYSRALSASEILSIYNSGSAGKCLTPPVIRNQPTNKTNYVGTSSTFRVTAVGPDPITYKWQRNGTNLVDGSHILGSSSNNLSINLLTPSDQAVYSVIVSDPVGSVTSTDAQLMVFSLPSLSYTVSLTNRYQFIFSSTNGLPNAQYTILSSTNIAEPVSDWTPLTTSFFDATGSLKLTNTVNTNEQNRYYVLRTP